MRSRPAAPFARSQVGNSGKKGKKGLRLRARIHGKNKSAAGESVTGFVNTY